MKPSVSILLPVYNSAPWLAKAISSLLKDGFEDFELLILDDGSTDQSPRIAQMFARGDARIRLMPGAHEGLVSTLNRGLEASRAPFIARMDADDLSLPGRLQRQVDFLKANPKVAAVDSHVEIFKENEDTPGGMARFELWLNSLQSPRSMWNNLLIDSPIVHPAVMMRRKVALEVGAYIDDGPEDYHLWLRMAAAGHDLHKLPQTLFRWRDHEKRLTRTDERYKREAFWRLKWRFLKELGIINSETTYVVWGAGREARPWLRALREMEANVCGVLDIDPKKQNTSRHGYPTYDVGALDTLPWQICLCAVGAVGARPAIRKHFQERQIAEGPQSHERGYWILS